MFVFQNCFCANCIICMNESSKYVVCCRKSLSIICNLQANNFFSITTYLLVLTPTLQSQSKVDISSHPTATAPIEKSTRFSKLFFRIMIRSVVITKSISSIACNHSLCPHNCQAKIEPISGGLYCCNL